LLDDQKVPGPGHYNIKTSALAKNGAKIPKSKRDQFDLNGPGPGPGQYNIKDHKPKAPAYSLGHAER
jgi:hypothetical protein